MQEPTDMDVRMSFHFTVLASGSAGNASLLEAAGFGVLIDLGLGPRQLAGRLAESGRSWRNIQAALLTHTHSDHWNVRTLAALLAKRIPLHCHAEHLADLRKACPDSLGRQLEESELLRIYEDRQFVMGSVIQCLPLALRHDGGATFGFRFTGPADSSQSTWSLGYAADLGSWDDPLADALCDMDLLALEFNHDVEMQQSSGRHPMLIARVLGDDGHLSNEQAAELLRTTLRRSTNGRLQQLIQLHLSRQCNRPALALRAAQSVIDEMGLSISIHAAVQHRSSPAFKCGAAASQRMIRFAF